MYRVPPSGRWWPAVVARLARTLGRTLCSVIGPAESAPVGVYRTATNGAQATALRMTVTASSRGIRSRTTRCSMCLIQLQLLRFASSFSTTPPGIESQFVGPPPSQHVTAPSAAATASGIRNQRASYTFTLCLRSGRGIVAALPRVHSLIVPTVRPNTSLNRTRYGRQRKPGVRRLRHLRTPGLRCLP